MYSFALAESLRKAGIEALTVREMSLSGVSDADLMKMAAGERLAVLTENVADFARIASDWAAAGRHHAGILIALSSRFSRRPSGIAAITFSVLKIAGLPLDDQVVYLRR